MAGGLALHNDEASLRGQVNGWPGVQPHEQEIALAILWVHHKVVLSWSSSLRLFGRMVT